MTNKANKTSDLKNYYNKHRDIITYVIFGALTTLVNVVSYALLANILHLNTVVSTILAWAIAVAFAYVTNRIWVFRSKNTGAKAILVEACSFVAARLATGLLDVAVMYVCVDLWGWSGIIVKAICNIIAAILNYFASKLFIFAKQGNKKSPKREP